MYLFSIVLLLAPDFFDLINSCRDNLCIRVAESSVVFAKLTINTAIIGRPICSGIPINSNKLAAPTIKDSSFAPIPLFAVVHDE
ncbi:hypothetical protein ES708_32671 [subsurface metagenome]